MLSPMEYREAALYLLDQRVLPLSTTWLKCENLEEVALSIENMSVRGAPAIGCTAAFGLALHARKSRAATWSAYEAEFTLACQRLARTRPTAVNLFHAIELFRQQVLAYKPNTAMSEVVSNFERISRDLYQQDIATCKAIGKHGASLWTPGKRLRLLTHCNAGALATAAYGTALGVVRSLHAAGALEHVYVDETRPWLQGARLTAFELQQEGIPHTLVCEGAAAHLMQQGRIDWVIVGADRIAANGDTANKIGTYSLAVLARHHGLKFMVAAPWTTFDPKLATGRSIPIEERASEELTHFRGQQVAPRGCEAYNPSFDVTPEALIDWLVTETGVLQAPLAAGISRHFT